ncbi:TetR/AcrR family transcriptional regulator [Jiangella sp. DSM 45060]|uniref:TetR/AcrR family transcriptional regulator n=1 Tax=Jiangella sp. DSM 45060 TaxID=1798224 RepID=UPI00087DD78C|nr:TetR/AcrR family transcriptional regulator [Jiangella sp. DSM 45060]SDT13594.1 DNA-binding transcriptional regulator, AcrR family [Jiangella sp. DSM 45060]
MPDGPTKRRYDSHRRDAQALRTRAEIAQAARRLFLAQGWAATTVRDVAREAGVSAPTVYATYQSKTGLARALADAADLSADPARMIDELEDLAADPAGQLGAMAAYDRRLYERAGDVIRLIRDAGRGEPDLAALYTNGRKAADHNRRQVFESWPPGSLRDGLDLGTAIDIYAALCNIDAYTTLTDERRWTPGRIEQWWREALPRELLAPGRRRP